MAHTLKDWLSAYGESHQNKINKTLHWICVPVITWTVIALLWNFSIDVLGGLNLAWVFMLFSLIFYLRLSISITIGMSLFACVSIGVILLHEAFSNIPLWQTAFVLFVVAWIGQFIGHKIEGKKPSFFEDLQFLLIGPAWLLSFIYQHLGIRL